MKVVIIGGGLAGMAAALELRRYGADCVILEASPRLGGKAGADYDPVKGRYEEHGYHIFPAWYANVRAILAELGVPLTDEDRYHFLKAGQFPEFVTVQYNNPFSGRGLMPLPDRLLVFYFLVDMFGERLTHKHFLDRVSAMGLMRSKWYATEAMATFNQENLLKAVAVPAYELSAFTSRLVGLNFASNPKPFMSLLRGNLQETFIAPLAARIQAMGATVKLRHEVTDLVMAAGQVQKVVVKDLATGTSSDVTGDAYLWATNLEVARRFVSDDVYRVDPHLGRMQQLDAAPMSALHLYLNVKLAGFPREHVFLSGGKYALSCIDVSQHWSGLGSTTLSFIAADFLPLARLPEAEQVQALLDEIMKYVPISSAQIDSYSFHPNTSVPLFMNTITAWGDRPKPRTKIKNLFMGGDFVRSHIDLATMEGAVSSAMGAVAAMLDDAGIAHLPLPRKPRQIPRWAWRLAEVAAWPMVPPLWVAAKIGEIVRGAP